MTPEQYIESLTGERKQAVEKFRKIIKENLPEGFVETISNKMIAYVVPHSIYPKGYHTDPKQPLPFIFVASQKSHIAIYHMGIYADSIIQKWFITEYSKISKTKPDIGKSCIRFKKAEQIPYELIEQLIKKISVKDWVKMYESNFLKGSK